MVSTLGRGRMAAIVRALAAGNFQETKEEVGHEKLAAQAIHKKLEEANEANLLEEEDMHVFDWRPLSDPLHLVCCNACKKPIKVSQFAAHADRCRPLNSPDDIVVELDGGTGHKKPPRKGRKKLQTSHDNQVPTIGEQEKAERIDGDDAATLEPNMNGLSGFCREAKRTSTSIERALTVDGSGRSVGSAKHLDGAMAPSKRRTKSIAAEPLVSGCLDTIYAMKTEIGTSCEDAVTYAPFPLATKMYHLQRSRLRTALGHLYQLALAKECESNHLTQKPVQGNAMLSSQISSAESLLDKAEKGNVLQKNDAHPVPALQKLDENLAQSSRSLSGNSGGWPSTSNIPSQSRDSMFTRSAIPVDTAPAEMMRTRYLPTPYSFSSKSGTALGTVQKQNGSVSVV